MYYPTKSEFIKKAKQGNLIPVYKELFGDMDTPVAMFRRLEKHSQSGYLLESVEGGEHIGRYSFLGINPSVIFSSKNSSANPMHKLRMYLNKYNPVAVEGLPRFCGGAVGYIDYNIIRYFEDIPQDNPDDLCLPEMYFMITDTMIVFDHVQHKIKVVTNAEIDGNPLRAYESAVKRIERLIEKIQCKRAPTILSPQKNYKHLSIKSNFSRKGFIERVKRAKKYIRNGDIIQVVLSQRFQTKIKSRPFDIYRALRSVNPSPYMYYLKGKGFHIIGSSPELLVRCEDGVVETRPIAGTRPRGVDEEKDNKLARELLADLKERAEHIMLVDLGRNDIGRVCKRGSVRVTEFMEIEKYSHVMHIVSNVQGRLRKDKDQFDVLSSTFPAGTVTGAPKIRAMEIIDELENKDRGPYAGAVGYFSFSGNLDSAITIRTIFVKDGMAYIQAGAGIVADSVPEKEYIETVNKARGMIKAIELAETF